VGIHRGYRSRRAAQDILRPVTVEFDSENFFDECFVRGIKLEEHQVFLANVSPDLQRHVLDQVASPRVVAADTMNHWIANDRAALVQLLPRIDILTLNDEEARMLSGEHNLVKAGRAIVKMGPDTVLVKRGEQGVLQFSKDTIFRGSGLPALRGSNRSDDQRPA
jgi:hydroxymethylpyrimidine/phosphomethylpyrimidine kinase